MYGKLKKVYKNVINGSQCCEDEDVWRTLGFKSMKDAEKLVEVERVEGAMSSPRKASHSFHMHIATNGKFLPPLINEPKLGSLCSVYYNTIRIMKRFEDKTEEASIIPTHGLLFAMKGLVLLLLVGAHRTA